jgi:hypothetical protein
MDGQARGPSQGDMPIEKARMLPGIALFQSKTIWMRFFYPRK